MCGIFVISAQEGIEYIQSLKDFRSLLPALQIQCGNDGKRTFRSGLSQEIYSKTQECGEPDE